MTTNFSIRKIISESNVISVIPFFFQKDHCCRIHFSDSSVAIFLTITMILTTSKLKSVNFQTCLIKNEIKRPLLPDAPSIQRALHLPPFAKMFAKRKISRRFSKNPVLLLIDLNLKIAYILIM